MLQQEDRFIAKGQSERFSEWKITGVNLTNYQRQEAEELDQADNQTG